MVGKLYYRVKLQYIKQFYHSSCKKINENKPYDEPSASRRTENSLINVFCLFVGSIVPFQNISIFA
jgi:hypothetical protein